MRLIFIINLYIGFSEKDTSPFRFGVKDFQSVFKEELKINKDNKIIETNIITDRQDANYALQYEKISELANKLIIYKYKCNLYLHPYDHSHTLISFEAIKNYASLFIGIDKSKFKNQIFTLHLYIQHCFGN